MKVLIIPDSFKGSLTATEVSEIMVNSIQSVFPNSNTLSFPFSDGGEGALTVLKTHVKGKLKVCKATDALKRPLDAPYFLFHDQKRAWIELSQTAGLTQLHETERNALTTTTWGTGKMIENALDKGCETIYLGIGGSATQDLGTGIISALGGRFLDQNARELPFGGGELHRLQKIDLRKLNPKAKNCNWIIACDVENPLLGKQGTAHTYAKQKGASQKDIEKLEKGGVRFAEIVKKQFEIDLGPVKGGGAAGGVGAGLFGLLGARIENGFELLAELSGLKNHLTNMDLILTGEGSFDQQSLFGKLPIQVAKLANKEEIQTLIVAGNAKLEKLKDMPYCKILNCTPDGIPINEALKNAESNLKNTLVKELKNLKMQNK